MTLAIELFLSLNTQKKGTEQASEGLPATEPAVVASSSPRPVEETVPLPAISQVLAQRGLAAFDEAYNSDARVFKIRAAQPARIQGIDSSGSSKNDPHSPPNTSRRMTVASPTRLPRETTTLPGIDTPTSQATHRLRALADNTDASLDEELNQSRSPPFLSHTRSITPYRPRC